MKFRMTLLFLSAFAAGSFGQVQTRQATMKGSQGDRGKCTIEVEVDGTADVEIRGNQGRIRTLTGSPATWRRFECTDPLPPNPLDFKFSGVDGRGSQQLIGDPRSNSVAVIRIDDPKSGREGYTFDIEWTGNSTGGVLPNSTNWPNSNGTWSNNRDGRWTGNVQRNALRQCREAVRSQARSQYGVSNLRFDRDDLVQSGYGSISGAFWGSQGRNGRIEEYAWNCSVDPNSGVVQSANITPRSGPNQSRGNLGGSYNVSESSRECGDAVQSQLRSRGYSDVYINDSRMDNNMGRRDYVTGSATARRGNRTDNFSFSCDVNANNGRVRNVDVRLR